MTFADPPPGLHANAVSYGPALNAAAVPVSGEKWPWGDPHAYPYRPHRVGGNGEVFLRGAEKLGITAKVGPLAIVNGRFGNRPHCIYRGFCLQGCKVNAVDGLAAGCRDRRAACGAGR